MEVGGGGEGFVGDVLPAVLGEEEQAGGESSGGDEEGCGEEAAGAFGVEVGEGDPALFLEFFVEVGADEEAGDDEEDIYTDVAAGELLGPDVVDDDEQDGQGAEGLDIGAEAAGGGGPGSALGGLVGVCTLHKFGW